MKTPVAVTLIIMGALLIMTPVASDYLYQRNIVTIMTTANRTSVMLEGNMSEMYRFGCWSTGTGMIGIAVLCSIFAGRRAPERQGGLAAQAA